MFESVVNNPYLMDQIVAQLDIRSLCSCYSVSKEFFDAAAIEYERRKDIIHLYLLNYRQENIDSGYDVEGLFDSFRNYTRDNLNMRPKTALVLVGGYRKAHIDYRRKQNCLSFLSEFLPNNCHRIYLDVGSTVLTSSIRYKSLTNYSDQMNDSQTFHRTAFPCLSSLLIPDIDGVKINSYTSIESVNTKDVKAILLLISSKTLSRRSSIEKKQELVTTAYAIHELLARSRYQVAFGGASIKASKRIYYADKDQMSDHLIITFGGKKVRTASSVIRTTDQLFFHQLLELRSGLDFDCDDWQNSITIGFVLGNHDNFVQPFTTAFQSVFPCVGIFGIHTDHRLYGKHFKSFDTSGRSHQYSNIYSIDSTVVVLVNIEFAK